MLPLRLNTQTEHLKSSLNLKKISNIYVNIKQTNLINLFLLFSCRYVHNEAADEETSQNCRQVMFSLFYITTPLTK